MRYYVEQLHNNRWLSLASFPANDEATAFAYRMHCAGMHGLRIIQVKVSIETEHEKHANA